MTYRINKTDGNLLVDISDGILDTTTTAITLVGRNVVNFGESLNENFVKLLENFSSVSQPERALVGQLWYDTSAGKLKVYDGTNFRSSGGPIVNSNRPLNLVAGDLWIDSRNKQLYFYDGTGDPVLAGPVWQIGQGKSGFEVDSVLDTNNSGHTIVKLFVGSVLLGIFSRDTFRPLNPIDNFSGSAFSATSTYRKGERVRYFGAIYEAIIDLPAANILPTDTSLWREVLIQQGFTSAASSTLKFNVTATRAESILTATGAAKLADQIVYNDEDGVIVGSLDLQSNNGLTLGGFSNVRHRIEGNTYYIQNDILNNDISVVVKNTKDSPVPEEVTAIYIDASEERIGLFTSTPQATLDVIGDVRITGNLTVGGDSISEVEINATSLQVADSSIELNISGGVNGSDEDAAGGGIILRRESAAQTFLYQDDLVDGSRWELSDNLSLALNKEYKINNVSVLTSTTLGSSIVTAAGLTEIQSTLQYLNVDSVRINNNVISSVVTNGDLVLSTLGTGVISVNDTKITDLSEPENDQDAATKVYVDTAVFNRGLVLSLDVTGIATAPDAPGRDAQENQFIIDTLTTIAPIYPDTLTGVVTIDAYARIQTSETSVTLASIVYNPVEGINFTEITVDKGGVQNNQAVVAELPNQTISPPAATVSIVRKNKLFRVIDTPGGPEWNFIENI